MENPYVSPNEDKFVDYPEPPAPPETLKKVNDEIDDFYLAGLENYISKLGEHIRTIQNEETARMQRFAKQLDKLKTKSSKRREDAEEDARLEFQQTISAIRRKRKHYRQMERDALNERRKYLESMSFQKHEQEILRQKLLKLGVIEDDNSQPSAASTPVGPFALLFLVFEICLILAYLHSNFGKYYNVREGDYILENLGHPLRVDNFYTFFVHMTIFVFFGWGFLSSWLRKYAFTSITLTFMTAVFAFQFNYFMIGVWRNIDAIEWAVIPMTFEALIETLYGPVAVLVTFGAILGKITPLELLVMTFLEILAYSLNYYICIYVLNGVDPGGGITLHLFGALFALGVSSSLSETFRKVKTIKTDDLTSNYRSDVFSLIGTLLLFVFFPSFNAALAPNGTQQRAVINTILSLLASVVFAFLVSRTFRKKYISIRDVQTAAISGGIAIASAHSLIIVPGAALIVGAISATAVIIGNIWLEPFLEQKTNNRFSDTRGVISLHGVCGFMAAVGGIVATGIANRESIYGQPPTEIFHFGTPNQAGYQAAILFITIGISVGTGVIAGMILFAVRRVSIGRAVPLTFTDEQEFKVPNDFQRTQKPVEEDYEAIIQ